MSKQEQNKEFRIFSVQNLPPPHSKHENLNNPPHSKHENFNNPPVSAMTSSYNHKILQFDWLLLLIQ